MALFFEKINSSYYSRGDGIVFNYNPIITTNGAKNCGDKMFEFYEVKNHAETKFKCHISFHSQKSVYVMGKTRSTYSCGYYPGTSGTGALHYKIDKIPNITGSDKTPITKQFIPESENKILFIDNSADAFNNVGALTEEELATLNKHMRYFDEFIKNWNSVIENITSLAIDWNTIELSEIESIIRRALLMPGGKKKYNYSKTRNRKRKNSSKTQNKKSKKTQKLKLKN